MADSRTIQLVSASFKGVDFRVRNEIQSSAGRRVILHEYPNSDQRFVEDIGQIPPIFQIEAFVHGINYLARAQALEVALNEEGAGELILPTFGTVTAHALPYSKESNQTGIGEVIFRLEFALGRPTPGPNTRENQIEDLYDQGDFARTEIQIALALIWDQPDTALNIATAEYDILQTVQSSINQYNTLFVTSSLTAYQSLANDIARDRPSLVTDGALLAAALIQNTPTDPGLWQQTSLGVPNGFGTTQALLGTTFGRDLSIQSATIFGATEDNTTGVSFSDPSFTSFINLWPADTAARLQRNNNRRLLAQTYRVNSLVMAYEQAAAFDYSTEDQIIETRELLYQAYDTVMREGLLEAGDSESIQIQPGVRFAVESVRSIAGEILERKAQFSPGLTTVQLSAPRSALELAYLLYAEELTTTSDLENSAITLRGLNPALSAVALDGPISIFDRAPI